MPAERQQRLWEAITVRVAASLLIVAAGIAAMRVLARLRKPPNETSVGETTTHVKALAAKTGDYPVFIVGFGEVAPLNVSVLSSEVAGRVTEVNPRLETGERLEAGDLIVRLDSRDYRAARDEAQATARQLERTIQRLALQLRYDKERLDLLQRNRDLAETEFERARKLLTESSVGSQVAVDAAERAFNSAATQVVLLKQSVDSLPIQIVEAEQALVAARARVERAEINVERCTVNAPFACRVKSAAIELGQLASPNQPLATLADDSVLEIRVPVDSVDASRWLEFSATNTQQRGATWFGTPQPVPCQIRWTEDVDGYVWPGVLHRVVDFSSDTRTLVLAVRVDDGAAHHAEAPPLAEGMFCKVVIPGRTLRSVIRVPRAAVTYESDLYTVKSNRLVTTHVTVEYVDDTHAYISKGISAGDRIITTRLIDPLEGSLLDVTPHTETHEP